MKLHDRQFVEGTEPAVYIGHRIFLGSDGAERISNPWYTEYCLHNRQRFEALGAPNKNIAIQKAYAICARIRSPSLTSYDTPPPFALPGQIAVMPMSEAPEQSAIIASGKMRHDARKSNNRDAGRICREMAIY